MKTILLFLALTASTLAGDAVKRISIDLDSAGNLVAISVQDLPPVVDPVPEVAPPSALPEDPEPEGPSEVDNQLDRENLKRE